MGDLFSFMVNTLIYSFCSEVLNQTEAPLLDMFHICFSFSLPRLICVQMTFWAEDTLAANEVFVNGAQINQ